MALKYLLLTVWRLGRFWVSVSGIRRVLRMAFTQLEVVYSTVVGLCLRHNTCILRSTEAQSPASTTPTEKNVAVTVHNERMRSHMARPKRI